MKKKNYIKIIFKAKIKLDILELTICPPLPYRHGAKREGRSQGRKLLRLPHCSQKIKGEDRHNRYILNILCNSTNMKYV